MLAAGLLAFQTMYNMLTARLRVGFSVADVHQPHQPQTLVHARKQSTNQPVNTQGLIEI